MSHATNTADVPVATGELRATLEASLRTHFGSACRIVGFERRPSEYRTSFALDELDVRLGDGRHLQIIFKDLSPRRLLGDARLAKPEFLRDPRRELEVYRTLLEPLGLGTPICYGTVCDDARGRYWLLLEKIPGVELYQVGELEVWQQVARWLARLHTRFANGAPDGHGGHGSHGDDDALLGTRLAASRLLTYDASFYRRWPARALANLQQVGPVGREATVQEFARLANDYGRVAERLVALERTFIHGEFYASNILVTQTCGQRRVSPVDWEMAALGPGLIDLAALISGWSDQNRRAIALAYHEALPSVGRASSGAFLEALDYCQLHVAVQWLGWAREWSPPAEHAQDWLAESVRLAARLKL